MMEIYTVYNDILHVDWLYEDHFLHLRSQGYKIITSKLGLSSTWPAPCAH